jgi:hypothetical protein
MDVKVKMWNFLERRCTDGMPDAQSFVRKCRRDGARHARERGHERSAPGFIKLPHVTEVLARDDQRVAGMKLPKIDKSHGELVLENNTGRATAPDDLAKEAFAAAGTIHGPTRPRLIFAGKSKPIKSKPKAQLFTAGGCERRAADHDKLGLSPPGA